MTTTTDSPRHTPVALRLLAVPVLIAVLLLGLWLFAGRLAPSEDSAWVIGATWFVVVGIAIRFIVRGRRDLALPLRGTLVVVAVAVSAWVALTTFRDDKVDEQV